jgi:hypothetical protein
VIFFTSSKICGAQDTAKHAAVDKISSGSEISTTFFIFFTSEKKVIKFGYITLPEKMNAIL